MERACEAARRDLALPDAEISYQRAFLPPDVADACFSALRPGLRWQEERIRIFGRNVPVPRRVAWYGDPGAGYTYSGVFHAPLPWTGELVWLRRQVARAVGSAFNSVLANLYRDGRDSMGWHSDDEPELGPAPVIASVSLGAERRFGLRHRKTRQAEALVLEHGSLLVMGGTTQRHWQHALPKTARPVGERINLTFRWVYPAGGATNGTGERERAGLN